MLKQICRKKRACEIQSFKDEKSEEMQSDSDIYTLNSSTFS